MFPEIRILCLVSKEYGCYLVVYTASNPILLPQTERQQTLRRFQDFVGNSAEDGTLTLLMQIDFEIPPSQTFTKRSDANAEKGSCNVNHDFITQSSWELNLNI